MECPKCGAKLKVVYTRPVNRRMIRRLKRCTGKGCKWQSITTETY